MINYRVPLPGPGVAGLTPPVYQCPRTPRPFALDGDLSKPVWSAAPWTGDFQDIEGAGKPLPRFRTRAKMLYDDDALYVGAELQGDEIWATVTRRDEVIFVDNDFEIFIDPDADTHAYAEFEMNALNTVWDLLLTRPYRDGGRAVTSFDIKGLESAVKIDGTLNRAGTGRAWSVEVKIPFASILECHGRGLLVPRAPAPGSYWRVNFSRVQWLVDTTPEGGFVKRTNPATQKPCPEDNWVWAPTGLVNIHYPEWWGFVFFRAPGDTAGGVIPPDEYRSWKLRRLYYRLHAAFDETGAFPRSLEALAASGEDSREVTLETTSASFLLSCPSADGAARIILRDDGLVEKVHRLF